MLIEYTWKRYKTVRENYSDDPSACAVAKNWFILSILITLLVVYPLAIYLVLSDNYCGDLTPQWLKILIIVLMFVPFVGFPVAVLSILVGVTRCRRGLPPIPGIESPQYKGRQTAKYLPKSFGSSF